MVFSIYQMGRIVLSDRNTNIVDEGSLVTDCGSVAQCSVTAVYLCLCFIGRLAPFVKKKK